MIVIETAHFPPSTNGLFANIPGRGRIKSKGYLSWIDAAGYDCKRKGTISGPFKANIILSQTHRRSNADLDNRIKGPMDLLVTHGIVDDDSKCESLTIAWGECRLAMRIEIEATGE